MSALPVVEDGEVTRLLNALGRGESLDPDAHHQLFTRVYESLHRIARQQRARWKGNETLNATALVHEAYMKLIGGGGAYENRSHFLAVASRAMRHLDRKSVVSGKSVSVRVVPGGGSILKQKNTPQ